jgi:hypothetical protein
MISSAVWSNMVVVAVPVGDPGSDVDFEDLDVLWAPRRIFWSQ